MLKGKTYRFVPWSDGKSATHNIDTPAANMTYTATYKLATIKTLSAIADAYVRDGSFASTNYGTASELVTKTSAPGYQRVTYLKFDLTSISTITNAKLRLFGKLSASTTGGIATGVYAASATPAWTESSLTWNARPLPTGSALATRTISDTTARWYEWDLTSYLKQQKALGKSSVTLILKNPASTANYCTFNSRQAASNGPQLVITP